MRTIYRKGVNRVSIVRREVVQVSITLCKYHLLEVPGSSVPPGLPEPRANPPPVCVLVILKSYAIYRH